MYYIGIDVGGTGIKGGLVDEGGQILCRAEAKTLGTRPAEEIAADIVRLIKGVIKAGGVEENAIHSIGIGIPGACSEEEGKVIYTANMNFSGFPLRAFIQKEIKKEVHLANDANCAALGEYFALDTRPQNMVLITLGTGIGGGLVLGGHLYTGGNGIAGEVGHILLCPGGEVCGCGRRGCWEAYASVRALIRQTRAHAEAHPESALAKECGADFSALSGKTAITLWKEGDEGATEVVTKWMEYVAHGLVDMIHIFQPEVLLIGGAISREGEVLLSPIRRMAERDTIKIPVPKTEIRAARLGNDAGLIGAAFLGRQ